MISKLASLKKICLFLVFVSTQQSVYAQADEWIIRDIIEINGNQYNVHLNADKYSSSLVISNVRSDGRVHNVQFGENTTGSSRNVSFVGVQGFVGEFVLDGVRITPENFRNYIANKEFENTEDLTKYSNAELNNLILLTLLNRDDDLKKRAYEERKRRFNKPVGKSLGLGLGSE